MENVATTTAPQKKTRLFPAHLAQIDRFLLDDDSPKHPMTFVITLECEGLFDHAVFEAALNDAVDRHPYTHAKLGAGKRGVLSWVDSKGERPKVTWCDDSTPIDEEDINSIDLRKEVGLKVWVREGASTCTAIFLWHHSVADGAGAYRFTGDVLAIYDQRMGGQKSKLLELNPELLRERRARMADAFTRGDRRAVLSAIWRLFRDVFMRQAAPLAAPSQRGEVTFPGCAMHTFTKEETAAIRAAADNARVMLNDLLLERMFQAMRDWNANHNQRSGRPLRIMMPTDLRDSRETEMPAANMVGYTFLTRKSAECDDSAKLLRSVADESAQIVNSQRGKQFIDAICGVQVFPSALRWLLRRGWCLATTVVTNLGDPTRRMNARLPRRDGLLAAGNVVVTRFGGAPPLRDGTRLVVAISTYNRCLTLSLRGSPHFMGDRDTAEFLGLYADRLREVMATNTGA